MARKAAPNGTKTVRLLVLGDNQVGKTATIVRYTTGRFIHNYSSTTSDWLYSKSFQDGKAQNGASLMIEILEQKNIQFFDSNNLFSKFSPQSSMDSSAAVSLSSRVAMDQKNELENHEKQQLLEKLNWANAFVVVYAVNDINTFNKAIRYLNLIANYVNSSENPPSISNTNRNKASFHSSSSSSSSSSHQTGSKFLSRFSPNSGSTDHINQANQTSNQTCNSQKKVDPKKLSSSFNYRQTRTTNLRPILLVGNKSDLAPQGRQVNSSDARMLAIRHRSIFVELSAAESSQLIQNSLNLLVERVDVSNLTTASDYSDKSTTLTRWTSSAGARCSTLRPDYSIQGERLVLKSASFNKAISETCQPSKAVASKLVATCRPILRETSVQNQPSARVAEPLTRSSKLKGSTKYANLKSSFKKASMAIVGSRTLAKAAKISPTPSVEAKTCEPLPPRPRKRSADSMPPSDMSNSTPTTTNLNRTSSLATVASTAVNKQQQQQQGSTTGWIRSHIRLSRDSMVDAKPLSSLPLVDSTTIGSHQNSRSAKRPLFKYRNRRKTVAFEQIAPSDDGARHLLDVTAEEPVVIVSHENLPHVGVAKTKSTQSDSPSFVNLWADTQATKRRAPSSIGSMSISSNTTTTSSSSAGLSHATRPMTRNNSRSTLSRASTSGGSCEDSSDDVAPISSTTTSPVARPMAPRKKYQLVRSVQSTFLALTKSAPKKPEDTGDQLANYSIVKTPINMTKSESIRVTPVVGRCK